MAPFSTRRTFQLVALLVIVLSLPTLFRIASTGELDVGSVPASRRQDLFWFAGFIASALYLGLSLLLGRLEEY